MRYLTLFPSWLRFLIAFLLTMNILFRFLNIDGKVYSYAEAYTSLRISGYTVEEVKQQLFNGRLITRENFTQYQSPNLEKDLNETIMALAREEPQCAPLYYIIARFWVQNFGYSVTLIRSLSALISLLVLPCLYWLCRELFNVPLSLPGLAIALTLVSPMQLIYAQEAQEYILWLVTILLCNASLLRAIRLESKDNNELAKGQNKPDRFTTWGIYLITLSLSLYTCLWSGFIAFTHGIYIITISSLRLTETVRAYLIATALAFLFFMPWLLILLGDFFQFLLSEDGKLPSISLLPLMPFLLMQVSRIFFDLNFRIPNIFAYFIILFFFILVGCAIYYIYRTTNYKVWFFVIALIIVPAIPLILPDIISGGIHPASAAYLIPSYLGIQLAVSYLLATQIYNGSLASRRFWQVILGLVIICGLISCRVSYQAETWWHKGISYTNPQVARIINQSMRPLLISNFEDVNYGNIFSLSYLLKPKVKFQLVNNQTLPKIPESFNEIFLLNPSDRWRKQIAAKYNFKTVNVYNDDYYSVWKLTKPRMVRQRVVPRRNRLFVGRQQA